LRNKKRKEREREQSRIVDRKSPAISNFEIVEQKKAKSNKQKAEEKIEKRAKQTKSENRLFEIDSLSDTKPTEQVERM
jgi:Ser-tRNA(Ala) deacylase AlaX